MGALKRTRAALYAALVVLYLLHNDLWLWRDGRFVLGLPVGLTYHVGYCLAAAALFALLVRRAWPADLAAGAERPEP
jgi:Protein of unknown function (DUF3311)